MIDTKVARSGDLVTAAARSFVCPSCGHRKTLSARVSRSWQHCAGTWMVPTAEQPKDD